MTRKTYYQHGFIAANPDQQVITDYIHATLEQHGFTITDIAKLDGGLYQARVIADLSYPEASARAYVAFPASPICFRSIEHRSTDKGFYRLCFSVQPATQLPLIPEVA